MGIVRPADPSRIHKRSYIDQVIEAVLEVSRHLDKLDALRIKRPSATAALDGATRGAGSPGVPTVGNASTSSNDGDHIAALPAISTGERRLLLAAAREAATAFLAGNDSPKLTEKLPGCFGGAFVTLLHGQRLRGCIGSFATTTDIVATVQTVMKSALQDSRFASCRVTLAELGQLMIEISLLTTPQPTDDPMSLVRGVHGIVVKRGNRSGCFLPKVATERNWSLEEFLSNCCTMKARLPADAWKDDETKVSSFLAEVFSDRDESLRIPGR